MIKHLVLDMGNVCCRWDMDYLASKLTDDKYLQKVIVEGLFLSPQWQMLDQGIITEDEALKQVQKRYLRQEDKDILKYAINHWYDYFDVFDDVEQWIKNQQKQGYDFYLLSNCSIQFEDYYQTKSIFQYFQDFYISAKSHYLKPNQDIYLDFLKKYDLKAEECLFIDDMEVNVEGAKKVGMKAYCFDGDVQKLTDYLINNS